jgi:hypothetical protein
MTVWQRTVTYQWSAGMERQAHNLWQANGPKCGPDMEVMAVSDIEQVSTAYSERQLDGTIAIRDLEPEDHDLILAGLNQLVQDAEQDLATQVLRERALRLLARIDAPAS